jgi:RNA polymerase sigma-70 factor (ECF subfamily)
MASSERVEPAGQADANARLEELLEELGGFLKATIRRLCPRTLGIQADEIEQDVRLRLWRSMKDERILASPASYMYRAAAAAVIDAVRRVKARREEPLQSIEAGAERRPDDLPVEARNSPHDLALASETRRSVEQGLGRLEQSRRRTVRLHLQGFGSQEIADLLGWTEPKARNLVYRGLEDLRRELRAAGMDFGDR